MRKLAQQVGPYKPRPSPHGIGLRVLRVPWPLGEIADFTLSEQHVARQNSVDAVCNCKQTRRVALSQNAMVITLTPTTATTAKKHALSRSRCTTPPTGGYCLDTSTAGNGVGDTNAFIDFTVAD